ncbi:hypothetical protein R1flu_005403 [Riccia fluitans]|uniref:MIR domain-containing protein n=1 Tax=Riccia fluitans TaxID=41844 RepID=A0ABD1YVU1_9MARC
MIQKFFSEYPSVLSQDALLFFKGNLSYPGQQLASWSDLSDPCHDKWRGVFCSVGLSNRVVEQLNDPSAQAAKVKTILKLYRSGSELIEAGRSGIRYISSGRSFGTWKVWIWWRSDFISVPDPQIKTGYWQFQKGAGIGFLAGMGLLVFGVLVLLRFLSPFETSGPQSAWASTGDGKEVTYGSLIKLQHDRTKYRLHSHEVPYGTGSGQQSVTGFPGGEDSNSYWVVKPVAGAKGKQGEVVADGSVIRLFHPRTRKWLHSHLHASPISNNYEVSAFGSDEQSDTGDHWKLIIEGKGKVWLRDQKVRFLHVDTGGYLHSHDKKYSRIVAGQQEVCGVPKKNSDNLWIAAEGVYFSACKDGEKESI